MFLMRWRQTDLELQKMKKKMDAPSDSSSKNELALWITYINIVLYALCFQLQRPVEPFLVKSLSEEQDDPTAVSLAYGRLESFFSTIQTFGSPLVGVILDRLGIRIANSIVFFASALSYGILASASTMELLFISKIPTALQAAFLVAQATAATATGDDAAARAQALGRMTTAYTIGATIGPALGGFLVDTLGDLYLGARLAVVGSFVSIGLSLMFLPHGNVGNANDNPKARSFREEVGHSLEIATRPNLWPLLVVKVVGGMAASMTSTAVPLVLTQTLKFDPSQLGMNMSTTMFSVAGFGAFCMAPLANWLGPPGMARTGLTIRSVLIVFYGLVVTSATGNDQHTLMRIVAVSILHALSSHVLATGLTTQTTGGVAKSEQGALLGLEHALFSLARIGAPPLATALLTSSFGFWTVALASAMIDVLLVALLVATAEQVAQGHKTKDDDHSD